MESLRLPLRTADPTMITRLVVGSKKIISYYCRTYILILLVGTLGAITPGVTRNALPRGTDEGVVAYLIFVIFLHGQNFWIIKFTPKTPIFCIISVKNATFSRKICRKCQFFALNL